MKTLGFATFVGQLVLSFAGTVLACGGYGPAPYCHKPFAPRPIIKQPISPVAPFGVSSPAPVAVNPGIGQVASNPVAPAPVGGGNSTPVPFVAPPSGGQPVAGGNRTPTPFVSGGNTTATPFVAPPQRGPVAGGNSTATPFIAPPQQGGNRPPQAGGVPGGNQTRVPFIAPPQRGR